MVLHYRTETNSLVDFNVKINKYDREGEVGKILNKDKHTSILKNCNSIVIIDKDSRVKGRNFEEANTG